MMYRSKLGLDQRETEMGLQAIASFKKDPVATARWMLQETMRLGYNLNQIVGERRSRTDQRWVFGPASCQEHDRRASAPLVQDRTQRSNNGQAEQAARDDYESSSPSMTTQVYMMMFWQACCTETATLTPEVAYWQLREYAAKQQLDFTKPLREQVAGASNRVDKQRPRVTRPHKRRSQQPMPNGGAPTQ